MVYFEGANGVFVERSTEIDRFLSFSSQVTNRNALEEDRNSIRLNEYILRSNIILMQYNLLESVFLEVFKEFYETIKNASFTLDNMSPQFSYNFYLLLKRSTNKTSLKVREKLFSQRETSFSHSAISTCFDLDEEEQKFLVNGNLDGRKIKDFLFNWGVDISTLEEKDVGCLKTLKDQRQLLAHGGQSFSATGRNATWEDIQSYKNAIETLFDDTKSLLSDFLNQLN